MVRKVNIQKIDSLWLEEKEPTDGFKLTVEGCCNFWCEVFGSFWTLLFPKLSNIEVDRAWMSANAA